MNHWDYIQYIVKPDLVMHDIEMKLYDDVNYVSLNSCPVSGYFCHEDKVLACAVGTKEIKDWFGTFLHEYCHFIQWKNNCDIWRESQACGSSDSSIDDWLNGEDVTDDKLDKELYNITYLEYDCESRTVELIKLFPTIFNVEYYTKQANAYIAFYHIMRQRREWYITSGAPYMNPEIVNNMPTTILPFEKYTSCFAFDHLNWNSCFE